MPLDPVLKSLLPQIASQLKFRPEAPVSELRKAFNDSALTLVKMANEKIYSVEDVTIPVHDGNIRARIYRPIAKEYLPAVVYYHGGGFVFGSIDTHDHVCRRISRLGEVAVISVDYRLAPEHKFPTAVEDAYAALKWVTDNATKLGLDSGRIAVAGDSAGGNLATVVSIIDRDKQSGIVKYQVLIYPVVNMLGTPTTSIIEYSSEEYVILTTSIMRWFGQQYLRAPQDAASPYASPILANLSGLPPALIITAEYDPLRDEGEIYGHLLRRHGVDAVSIRYNGVIHGFVNFYPILAAGREAIAHIAASIKSKLYD